MHDLHHNAKIKPAISPQVGTDDTPFVSTIIDRANAETVEFAIATGTLADADVTATVLVEEGDAANLSDAAAVADDDLLGTEAGAAISFADDDEARKIGYIGAKRYVRLTVTPANNTGNFAISAVAILSGLRDVPQTAQVQS